MAAGEEGGEQGRRGVRRGREEQASRGLRVEEDLAVRAGEAGAVGEPRRGGVLVGAGAAGRDAARGKAVEAVEDRQAAVLEAQAHLGGARHAEGANQ